VAEEAVAPPWPNGAVDFDAAHKLAKSGKLTPDAVEQCVVKPAAPEPAEAPAPASEQK
jgi:hypothetical protein